MPRVTKPAQERRQEIIETAKGLFLKNGFDRTQVSDIAKGMQVAQGLVYHYFKSKAEILYAVVDGLSREQVTAAGEALAGLEGSASSCLSLLLSSMPGLQSSGSLFGDTLTDQGVKAYCGMKMTLSMLPLLLKLIRRGNADGSWLCEYPGETAAFILHGINGLYAPERTDPDGGSNRAALTDILNRLLGLRLRDETGPIPGPVPLPIPEALPRRLPKAQDKGPGSIVSPARREELPECLL